MKRACVIGWPIEHSRSPLIHGYWLKQYGIAGTYTKEAVRPEDLPGETVVPPEEWPQRGRIEIRGLSASYT